MSELEECLLALYAGLGSAWSGICLFVSLSAKDRLAARGFFLTPIWPFVLLYVLFDIGVDRIKTVWELAAFTGGSAAIDPSNEAEESESRSTESSRKEEQCSTNPE